MLDAAIIVVYLGIIVAVGVLSSRKVHGFSDFLIGSNKGERNFSTFIVFATLSASFIGGGFSIGNAEKVFLIGIVNIVALYGFSVKEILVARFIAPRMDRYSNAMTVGDIVEVHYGKWAKVTTGVLALLFCAGVVGAQIKALGMVSEVFLGIDPTLGIIIGVLVVIIYSAVGGMRGVIMTDVVQFVLLSVIIPITLVVGIIKIGGFKPLMDAVPAGHMDIPGSTFTVVSLVSYFFVFMFGETLVPPYVQRLLIAKDKKAIARGTLFSGLFSIPFFTITGLLGLVALAMDSTVPSGYALPYVIQEALPIGIRGLALAGIIAIVMSSADSFLIAVSAAFTQDIVKPLRKKEISEPNQLKLARIVIVVVGLLGTIFALNIDNVLDVLTFSYSFWAPMLLVPIAAGIMGAKATKQQFFASAIAGAVALSIWDYILHQPFGIDGIHLGILANLIVFFGYGYFMKKD